MTDDIGELWAELGIEDGSSRAEDDGCEGDVSEGDTLSDEVCAGREVCLDGLQATDSTLDEDCVESLVVGKDVLAQLEDKEKGGLDLVVGDGDPLVDETSLLGVRRKEGGVGSKRSDWGSVDQ